MNEDITYKISNITTNAELLENFLYTETKTKLYLDLYKLMDKRIKNSEVQADE